MTIALVILVLLALAFGIGAVIEGLLWLLLIAIVLFVAAVVFGVYKFRQAARAR